MDRKLTELKVNHTFYYKLNKNETDPMDLLVKVEIVYNENIPTVLIEGLKRFTQEQRQELPMLSSTT